MKAKWNREGRLRWKDSETGVERPSDWWGYRSWWKLAKNQNSAISLLELDCTCDRGLGDSEAETPTKGFQPSRSPRLDSANRTKLSYVHWREWFSISFCEPEIYFSGHQLSAFSFKAIDLVLESILMTSSSFLAGNYCTRVGVEIIRKTLLPSWIMVCRLTKAHSFMNRM